MKKTSKWERAVQRFRGVKAAQIAALRAAGLGTPEKIAIAGERGVRVVDGIGPQRSVRVVRFARQWCMRQVAPGLVPPSPDRIRRERRAAGLTQTELGELLGGVTKMGVSHWECGRVLPTERNAARLVQVLPALAA